MRRVSIVSSYVACVGARKTPSDVLAWKAKTGAEMVRRGYTIVSGNAPGGDQAWASGGNTVDPTKVVLCLPWIGFERQAIHRRNIVIVLSDMSMESDYHATAERYHSRWDAVTSGGRKLLARNVMIVEQCIGAVGWIDPTNVAGGTRAAFTVAEKAFRIPTWDLAQDGVRDRFLMELDKRRADVVKGQF
jgi:hypothetical protein